MGGLNAAVARYGEIGTKSNRVQNVMVSTLRQRIEDRLEYEEIEYEKVSNKEGRIVAETHEAEKTAQIISNIPGVKTVSPVVKTQSEMEAIKEASEFFDCGETFGVRPNTGHTEMSSRDIGEKIGAYFESLTGAEVDLDNPETELGVDVRQKEAYIFTEKLQGPGGFPVGTQGRYGALISGGIDSPVAAYEMMTRGAEVLPIYFYNKPIAAEDHLMRFMASVRKLKRFNPARDWKAYIVDMKEVNEELLELGRGRMVIHRKIMLRVAEKIAEEENLNGLVTGESLGQKSSQTNWNMEITSKAVDIPLMRPLLTEDKNSISNKARGIATFEEAEIDSACRSLSPENPATKLSEDDLEELESKINLDELVQKALESRKVEEF